MIRLIFTEHSAVRDSLARILGLEKKEDGNAGITLYQRHEWLLVYSPNESLSILFGSLLEMYQPDRLYLPHIGRSVDLIHERGDIVLPNVFFGYNPLIETTEIDKDNQDSFLGTPEFLELYNEQKDYYVEDFGLSVGGIVVDRVPNTPDIDSKLLQAYEADVYVESSLIPSVVLIKTDEVPTILSVGIIAGKQGRHESGDIVDMTMRNMVTTWRLLDEAE